MNAVIIAADIVHEPHIVLAVRLVIVDAAIPHIYDIVFLI